MILRALKWLGLGLLSLLLLLAIGAGIYAWRASPKLSGELRAPALKNPVTIQRDESDVTHILAKSEADAAFALGYTHAQERGWQLEFNRRVMHGRLSEFLGEATLETDKLMRTLGIRRVADAQYAKLSTEQQTILKAYADGINSFHQLSGQALPPEFHILRIQPQLWEPQDSVGWTIMMALDLGGNWGTENARAASAQFLNTQRLWEAYGVYEGQKPAATADVSTLYKTLGLHASTSTNATKNIASNVQNTPTYWQKISKFSPHELAQQLQDWTDRFGHGDGTALGIGSNNWLVHGSKTQSGKPLLANDPHLGLTAPAIWYFARLQAPGVDAIGATLPGIPGIVLGRTANVSWGFTNTGPDVQDLFIERIDAKDPSRYEIPCSAAQTAPCWATFASRSETVRVKGKPDVTWKVRSTRHGPVLSDALKAYEWLNRDRYALALQWTALGDESSILPGWQGMKAQTVAQWIDSAKNYVAPMQNVVLADTAGSVAYQTIGRLPIRSKDNDLMGLVPAPGWEAKYDWQGLLPFDQNPKLNDAAIAAKGFHATANQDIRPAEYPHFMGQDWAANYRQRRIETLLQSQPKHSLSTMRDTQADTVSLATLRLKPHFEKALRTALPNDNGLINRAAAWDGNMRADDVLPLLFTAWIDQFTRGALAPQITPERFKAQYTRRTFRSLAELALERNDTFWCGAAGCDALSASSMGVALEWLKDRHGADLAKWQWGQAHVAISRHNPLGNVKALSRFFDVTVPTSGDAFTVNVGAMDFGKTEAPYANRHAASLRTLFDMADPEQSTFIYQTGQSGLVWSSRYRDMSTQWQALQARPLRLKPQSIQSTLTLVP